MVEWAEVMCMLREALKSTKELAACLKENNNEQVKTNNEIKAEMQKHDAENRKRDNELKAII